MKHDYPPKSRFLIVWLHDLSTGGLRGVSFRSLNVSAEVEIAIRHSLKLPTWYRL